MNHEKILKEIQKKFKLDDKQMKKIGKIIMDNIIPGKGSKEKMITGIMKELGLSEKDANKIYDTVMDVIGKGIKDKIMNPFGKKKKVDK